MSDICYVNGRYINQNDASVSINDRGLQFGDAIYEVVALKDSVYIDEDMHLNRLHYSANSLGIKLPFDDNTFKIIIRRLVRLNKLKSGLVYIQIGRGIAPREHIILGEMDSSIIITTKKISFEIDINQKEKGIKVISHEDKRHDRVDIKTTMLLPNCLAKTAAYEQGCSEAILIKNGYVTEACSANFWIITKDNIFVTHPSQSGILRGITRETLLKSIKSLGYIIEERMYTLEEVYNAKEAFISSASMFAMPVVQVDEQKIGDGKVGDIMKSVVDSYFDSANVTK